MTSKAERQLQWLEQHRWLLPLFVFCIGILVLSFSLPTEYILSKRGKVTEATITGGYGRKTIVACTYEVDGIIYHTGAETPKDISGSPVEYSPSLIGRKVLITYDPQNPETALDGDRRGTFGEQLALMLFSMVLFSTFIGLLLRYGSLEPLKRLNKNMDRIDERIKRFLNRKEL